MSAVAAGRGLSLADWAVLGGYLLVVAWVGLRLKRRSTSAFEFLEAGRALPAWICGLAFISANLGAQEVIGMAASGAKYGLPTCHFYWIGAIPAMIFLALFMIPVYYGSKARSVPDYLNLRFDGRTRALNAGSFAAMTVFSSGISLYAMARLLERLGVMGPVLGWMGLGPGRAFDLCVWVSAAVVLLYVLSGGLRSAIYNEVFQFFILVGAFLPMAIWSFSAAGGFSGLRRSLPAGMTHLWLGPPAAPTGPLGADKASLIAGLGIVLSFGYWCTDFLVIQRALAAKSAREARRVPLMGAFPKIFIPFLVVLPGLAAKALALIPLKMDPATGHALLNAAGRPILDYDMAVPELLFHFYPHGLLGLGILGLWASFMSGMAGNVTAFNTIWTYDLYGGYVNPGASDAHYLKVGRLATVGGVAFSILAAYAAARFNNMMDFLQLVFAFVNAPLFATFFLGMFWRRATGTGAFWGLILGTAAAALHHGLSLPVGETAGLKGGWIAPLWRYSTDMAQNFSTALWAFGACLAFTSALSFLERPREDGELRGLLYATAGEASAPAIPSSLARAAALALLIVLSLNFLLK